VATGKAHSSPKRQQENCSFADVWTSKNSVYAFAGTVAFWIDDDWNLHERVIELLPLSGDHTGKASGKLIYKALRRRGIETKLST
jgi:hypothetical protein